MAIQVFVACTDDEKEERAVLERVLNRIEGQERYDGKVHLWPRSWDRETLNATEDPQEQILQLGCDPRLCDIVVGIFKYRLGSPLGDAWQRWKMTHEERRRRRRSGKPRTGSEWEIDAAMEAARKDGGRRPYVMVFHLDTKAHLPGATPEEDRARRDQKSDLEDYLADLKPGGVYPFTDEHDFHEQILDRLAAWVDRSLGLFVVKEGVERATIERIDPPYTRRHFTGSNPFPGLRPYDAEFEAVFFGREIERAKLLRRVHAEGAGFVCVSGPSGSGKSSLARASLLPADLRDLGWTLLTLVPGEQPLLALAEVLQGALPAGSGYEPDRLRKRLAREGLPAFREYLRAAVVHAGAERAVLLVDQFEELFTAKDTAQADAFLRLLVGAVVAPLPVVWVGTLRADFLEAFTGHTALTPLGDRNLLFSLNPIRRTALELAITDSLAAMPQPYTIDDALLQRLLDETEGGGGAGENLPLLNYTLHELFEQARDEPDRRLRPRHLEALVPAGGDDVDAIAAVLRQSAESAFAALDRTARDAAKVVFPALVEAPRSGVEGWTRRRASKSALLAAHEGAERFIARFSRPHTRAGEDSVPLLRTAAEAGEETVEVWHERLFDCWPLLKSWLDERRELIHERDAANLRARRWVFDLTPGYFRDWDARRLRRLRDLPRPYWPDDTAAFEAFLWPCEALLESLDDPAVTPTDRAIVANLVCGLDEDTRTGVGLDADGLPDLLWVPVAGGGASSWSRPGGTSMSGT